MVEFEHVVGKALASEDDPDYEVVESKLYQGQRAMVRPYPLPPTVKVRDLSLLRGLVVLGARPAGHRCLAPSPSPPPCDSSGCSSLSSAARHARFIARAWGLIGGGHPGMCGNTTV